MRVVKPEQAESRLAAYEAKDCDKCASTQCGLTPAGFTVWRKKQLPALPAKGPCGLLADAAQVFPRPNASFSRPESQEQADGRGRDVVAWLQEALRLERLETARLRRVIHSAHKDLTTGLERPVALTAPPAPGKRQAEDRPRVPLKVEAEPEPATPSLPVETPPSNVGSEKRSSSVVPGPASAADAPSPEVDMSQGVIALGDERPPAAVPLPPDTPTTPLPAGQKPSSDDARFFDVASPLVEAERCVLAIMVQAPFPLTQASLESKMRVRGNGADMPTVLFRLHRRGYLYVRPHPRLRGKDEYVLTDRGVGAAKIASKDVRVTA